jgi:hypothetical protein
MRSIRLIVLGSFLTNLLVVGYVVFSAPGMKAELSQQANSSLLQWVLTVGLIFLVASLPWLYAFYRASSPARTGGSLAIALVALIAWVIVLPGMGGPVEALGIYVALYLLTIWVVFAVVLFRG